MLQVEESTTAISFMSSPCLQFVLKKGKVNFEKGENKSPQILAGHQQSWRLEYQTQEITLCTERIHLTAFRGCEDVYWQARRLKNAQMHHRIYKRSVVGSARCYLAFCLSLASF
jgi:hypothetical protein